MAEEFGFHEGFGNGGAVDGHEGAFRAVAAVVNGLGDEVLAGAAFSLNENRCGFTGGDLVDELHQLGDFARDADDIVIAGAAADFPAKGFHFGSEFAGV